MLKQRRFNVKTFNQRCFIGPADKQCWNNVGSTVIQRQKRRFNSDSTLCHRRVPAGFIHLKVI